MIEKWLPCPGYEATHIVSSEGRVQSLAREVPSCYGCTIRKKERLMKFDNSSKYARVQLKAKGKKESVHRLVAMAFHKPSGEEQNQVNHIDGNKMNNTAANLEWCSCSENIRHSFDNGMSVNKKGADNPMSKPLYVYRDGELVRLFASTRCAANFLKTSTKTIDNHIRSWGGRYKGMVLTRTILDPNP